jgi:type VI secretion system protein ImpI
MVSSLPKAGFDRTAARSSLCCCRLSWTLPVPRLRPFIDRAVNASAPVDAFVLDKKPPGRAAEGRQERPNKPFLARDLAPLNQGPAASGFADRSANSEAWSAAFSKGRGGACQQPRMRRSRRRRKSCIKRAENRAMSLTLQLVNETALPDGGPVSFRVNGKRGIDIGRAAHLDWTLPDPTRYISSKHCEIRYKDGGYWLHDVSTNGTFLNGAVHRMPSPQRLRNGDQFTVGHYVVAVTIDGAEEAGGEDERKAAQPPVQVSGGQELWADVGGVAPAIDPKQLRPARDRAPVHADFLDWAADVPDPFAQSAPHTPAQPAISTPAPVPPVMNWTAGAASLGPVPPRSHAPSPVLGQPKRQASDGEIWQDTTPFAPDPPPSVAAAGGSLSFSNAENESAAAFVRQLARSAGLSEDLFERTNPADLAQQIGIALRLLAENLMQLLSARQQAKGFARSSSHTIVEATDNNPLKLSPSAHDALAIMFGPVNSAYLDAHRAILQAFEDLKVHQIQTYSAMQQALAIIVEDLDPKKMERETEGAAGISSLFQSRNAKLWDAYKARWEDKIGRKGGTAIEAFMQYFAEYYDRKGG